jgi:hypothetical protein
MVMGEKLFLESVDKMGISEVNQMKMLLQPFDQGSSDEFDYIEFLDQLYHDFVDYKKRS